MASAEPLASLPAERVALQKFASPDLGELDAEDRAEVASLLPQASRPATQAFLAALCGDAKPKVPGAAAAFDADDISEVQSLLAAAKRPANAAFLSSLLAADDRHEVLSLVSYCTRPRNRGVLQLIAAGLSADSCRAAAASTPKSNGEAAAAAPAGDAPPTTGAAAEAAALDMESAILLVHTAAHAATAHEIAQIVCGRPGVAAGLPAPLEAARSHLWRVVNRHPCAG